MPLHPSIKRQKSQGCRKDKEEGKRDKSAGRRKDIPTHRKEELHRERCPDKPMSTWAVMNVMKATGGVRVESICTSSLGAIDVWLCPLLSLSLIHRTGHLCTHPPLLPESFGGPASYFAKRCPRFVICGQGDNLSHRSTRKT